MIASSHWYVWHSKIYAALLKANYPFFKTKVDVWAISVVVSGDSYLIHTKPYPTLNTSMELIWKETFIPLSQLALFVEIVLGKYIGMTSKNSQAAVQVREQAGGVWIK